MYAYDHGTLIWSWHDMTYEALVTCAMIGPPATSCPCAHGQEQPGHPGLPAAD